MSTPYTAAAGQDVGPPSTAPAGGSPFPPTFISKTITVTQHRRQRDRTQGLATLTRGVEFTSMEMVPLPWVNPRVHTSDGRSSVPPWRHSIARWCWLSILVSQETGFSLVPSTVWPLGPRHSMGHSPPLPLEDAQPVSTWPSCPQPKFFKLYQQEGVPRLSLPYLSLRLRCVPIHMCPAPNTPFPQPQEAKSPRGQ